MRIIKEATMRQNEILDVAETLFSQKGFDATSTNDILEKVGIARGTLYYHFKSKEDIMDALIDRYTVQRLAAAQKIAVDKELPKERIIRVVMALNISDNEGSEEILEHIHKPQNALMHQKIQRAIVNGVTPILAEIIREGVAQGIFHTAYPYECMEMLMVYANTVFDGDLIPLTESERGSRIQAFIFNAERLLGMKEDSFIESMRIFDKRK